MKQVFIDGIDEEGTIVPQAPQGFAFPLGNFGPWHKHDAYEVSGYGAAEIAKAMELEPDLVLVGRTASEKGTWDKLYYLAKRQPEALSVQRAVRNNEQAFVTSVTQFACKASDVLPEPLEFELVYTVNKRNYGTKNSQNYQLITLPSMVHAYAVMSGWDVPQISFREITDHRNYVALEGDELAKFWDKLLLQRANLWSALGETNMKVDVYMGAKTSAGEDITGANVTTSAKLSEALKIATTNWRGGFYAHIGPVAEPANAKGKVPVVIGLYENKDEALAAINNVNVEPVVSEYSGLHFPESFRGSMVIEEYASVLVDDTKTVYANYKSAPTGPKKVQAKAALNQKLAEFELTEEQYVAWANKLGF